MSRNDFFKYILLRGTSQTDTAELESEALPYLFKSNGHRLRNYRIYGNTVNEESVGNLVTEGEHSGEYLVPVTVEGKNLFDISTVTANAFINTNSGVVTPSSTSNSSVSDFIPVLANENYIFSFDVNLQAGFIFIIAYYDEDKTYLHLTNAYGSTSNVYHYQLAFTPTNNGFIRIKYSSNSIKMQVEKGSSSTPYEPYHEPQTVNIYLDEQLNENDYIDFRRQKRYPSGDMISLPAIPTIDGTNIFSVATETQPSKIYLQGNITEIETVSAQALQTNIQSLQPLSLDENAELDVMPSDKNEFQTNDISEMPVEDENSIEEILETENLETTGDDENAE